MHSFSLYSRGANGTAHSFSLISTGYPTQPLIETRRSTHDQTGIALNQHWVDVSVLHRRFENAVELYRQDLLEDTGELQQNFAQVYGVLGETAIGLVSPPNQG